MNYENIFNTLLKCEDKINNQLQEIEWWSNVGSTGPRGALNEEVNKKHCIYILKKLQKDIDRLSYYIEHGDKGVENQYNNIIKSLKENGAVM